MSSRIITPPDKILTAQSYLVINAIDTEIDTLVLWLKTVPEQYDIHLWHVQMQDQDMWLLQTINGVQHVLVNRKYEKFLSPVILKALDRKPNKDYFGQETSYSELIHWFLQNRIKNI